jgi:hypothetical protein
MKRIPAIILFLSLAATGFAETDLTYYLPRGEYNPAIPLPGEVTGYPTGEWHLSHDKLVHYLRQLAETSDRMVYQEYSRSWENRPLFHLVITSPANHRRLENIRQEHLKLADPGSSAGLDIERMPAVVRLGYGVHGNESSASNASVLVAYYLAASENPRVREYLDNMVILLDPCLNPDGFNRHASWINMHKPVTPMQDDNSRGFNEAWPGGRTNHYWFDLNRDWVLVQQPETRGRVKVYHDWLPNLQTDHHEMGSSSSFFFQPGVPSRTNPWTPQRTTDLTKKMGTYHQAALDGIGSLYFTEERFDDFYYGKGSSYPDVLGGVGILFEQAGTRGFERETPRGKLTFPFAIRNQVAVSLSSLSAAMDMKQDLLEHMRAFYGETENLYHTGEEKAYIFGGDRDASRTGHMLDILLQHRVEVYSLGSTHVSGDHTFTPGDAYIVPLNQVRYRLIQSLFRPEQSFSDSIFYDISAWNLPYAMNIPCATILDEEQIEGLIGDAMWEAWPLFGDLLGSDEAVGYLFRWDDYYAGRALYEIQEAGIITRVATRPFHYRHGEFDEEFGYGSIFIPAARQAMGPEELRDHLHDVADRNGVNMYALGTSYTLQGMDLGSGQFARLEKPKILLLVGEGIRSPEAGEVWHLLDARMGIPVVLLKAEEMNSMDLSGYTHLVMPSGSYSMINEGGTAGIESWLKRGGTLIALNSANRWLSEKKLADITFQTLPADSGNVMPYSDLMLNMGAQRIPGTIFEAELDLGHPIAYGLHRDRIPVFRSSTLLARPPASPYAQPLRYTQDPLLSGYVPAGIYDQLRHTPGIIIGSLGSGKLISFIDNPNFRAYWYGTNRLFINAIFFGPVISGYSTR